MRAQCRYRSVHIYDQHGFWTIESIVLRQRFRQQQPYVQAGTMLWVHAQLGGVHSCVIAGM